MNAIFIKYKILCICILISCTWHLIFSFAFSLGPREPHFLTKQLENFNTDEDKKNITPTVLDFDKPQSILNADQIIPLSLLNSIDSDTNTIYAPSLPVWDDTLTDITIKREIPPLATPINNIHSMLQNQTHIINNTEETTLTPYVQP